MWLCFNDGFVSIVRDKNNPKQLVARARRKQHLVDVLGKKAKIIKSTPDADYAWRSFITAEKMADIVAGRVEDIDYTNFKASVPDRELHDLYLRLWFQHKQYQRS